MLQLSLGAWAEDINPPGSSSQIHRELIHGLAQTLGVKSVGSSSSGHRDTFKTHSSEFFFFFLLLSAGFTLVLQTPRYKWEKWKGFHFYLLRVAAESFEFHVQGPKGRRKLMQM